MTFPGDVESSPDLQEKWVEDPSHIPPPLGQLISFPQPHWARNHLSPKAGWVFQFCLPIFPLALTNSDLELPEIGVGGGWFPGHSGGAQHSLLLAWGHDFTPALGERAWE